MKSPHSPLPWVVRRLSGRSGECFVQAPRLSPKHGYDIEVLGDDVHPELYPPEMKEADAEFIARAANNFEAVRRELDEAALAMEWIAARLKEPVGNDIEASRLNLEARARSIRAVIQKTEGG